MATTKVIIALQYNDTEGTLGNRWKDGKTYLLLYPAPSSELRAGEAGKWNSDRESDIDSSGGTEHAVYTWNIVDKKLEVLTAGWSDPRDTKVLVTLNGVNYIEHGSGSGTFNFRNGVSISWKIEATEAR